MGFEMNQQEIDKKLIEIEILVREIKEAAIKADDCKLKKILEELRKLKSALQIPNTNRRYIG